MALSKGVAELSVLVTADTSRAETELKKMQETGRRTSVSLRESMTEGRAGIKQLGEEIGINLNRHLVSFLAKLPGVAPVMAAAFPIAAVIGIGGALFEAGKKLTEFVQKNREAAGAITEGFAAMHQTSKLAADELTVTNDKLEEELAKLTGQRPNTLKTMLHEAVVEADKLVESLKRVEHEQDGILKNKDNQVSAMGGFFLFKEQTKPTADWVGVQQKALSEISERYQDLITDAKTAQEAEKLRAQERIELLEKEKKQLSDVQELYNYEKKQYDTGASAMDPSAVLAILGGRAHVLQDLIRSQQEETRNQQLKGQIGVAVNPYSLIPGGDMGKEFGWLFAAVREQMKSETADRAANAAADAAKNAADFQDWLRKMAVSQYGQIGQIFRTPETTNVALDPDLWKDLRSAVDETIRAFTDLPAHIAEFFREGVGTINSELAKLLTGQKTNFPGALKHLGESGVKMGLQNIEGIALKHIPGLDKWLHPGQKTNTMNVQATVVNLTGGVSGAAAGTSAGGGSGLLGLVGAATGFLTPRAFGGQVLAGQAYDVGEMGRETFVPHSNGTIVPNHMLSGNGAYYEIHAEGADAAVIEQRVARALERVHGSAVQNAAAVMADRRRRMPNR